MNFTEGDCLDAEPRKVIAIDIKSSAWTEHLCLTCNIWLTIEKLKMIIMEQRGVPEIDQHLFWCNGMVEDSLFLNEIAEKMENSQFGDQLGTILLDLEIVRVQDSIKKLTLSTSREIDSLVQNISKALDNNIKPVKKNLGVSGLYQLKNCSRSIVALFKPIDEEPVNEDAEEILKHGNPKLNSQTSKFRNSEVLNKFSRIEFSKSKFSRIINKSRSIGRPSVRKGIYSGELADREVAAYILDCKALHSVPPTCLVEIAGGYFESPHENGSANFVKRGSCQKFITNNGVVSNISFSQFTASEVQKIAALDLRILNCDRNESNILFKRSPDSNKIELVPIDHGLSLPDTLEIYESDLIWTTWPQAFETIDSELKEYILQLNSKEDSFKLKNNLNLRTNCLRNFRIAQTFLIKAVSYDMSLGHISKMMYRKQEDVQSPLEKIVEQTEFMYKRICKTVGRNFYVFIDQTQNQGSILQDDLWNSQTMRPRFGSYNLPSKKPSMIKKESQTLGISSFKSCICQQVKCNCDNYSNSGDEETSQQCWFSPKAEINSYGIKNTSYCHNMSTTISSNTPIQPIAFNFKRIDFSEFHSNENILSISKKTSLLEEMSSKCDPNHRIGKNYNQELFSECKDCHSQDNLKSNKENLKVKPPAKSIKDGQKKRIYLSDKSLTPVMKPIRQIVQNPLNGCKGLEDTSSHDSHFSFRENNAPNFVNEVGELSSKPTTHSYNPHSLQRSLSTQEKHSQDEILMIKSSREEGSIIGEGSNECNDELFFYFFESHVDRYLESSKLALHRHCSFDSSYYQM
jgi:hypothetical protein